MIKINALYLAVFPAYKVDHLINEIGMTYVLVGVGGGICITTVNYPPTPLRVDQWASAI
ncbi:MAG: hypothetical protein ACJASU_001293 [Cognaticolwellia sp.]